MRGTPNREMEIRHLAQADRHIHESDIRVQAMERVIAQAQAFNMNVEQATVSLALMIAMVAQLKAHRLMIVQAIEDLDRRVHSLVSN